MRVQRSRYGRNPTREETDPRILHLKIRVVTTRAMTIGDVQALLDRAVHTGIVPPGIEIRWIDWAHPETADQVATEGRMETKLQQALRDFYGAITQSATRFERVS